MKLKTSLCNTVLIFALSLVALPALALEPDAGRPSFKETSLLGWLWHGLGELLPSFGFSSGTMDPDGKPAALIPDGGSSPQTDASGTMDPDGGS